MVVHRRKESREGVPGRASHSLYELTLETKKRESVSTSIVFSISLASPVDFLPSSLSMGLPQKSASKREGPLLGRSGDPRGSPRDPRLWFFVRESAGLSPSSMKWRALRIKERSVVSRAAGCLIYWEKQETVCSRERAEIGTYKNIGKE